MNLSELENMKRNRIIIILFLLYMVGTVFFFFLGDFTKNIGFVPDERYYTQAAKALSNGDGMYYNGLKSTFQKIFYPLIISPAYKVNNLCIQIRLVCLLGVLFDMTSIFPVYLISRRLQMSRLKSLIICLISLSIPTFLYSVTFMSETAFLPLWLWVIYLALLILDTDEKMVLIPVFLGIVCYALYLCKEVGIVAIPALCLTRFICCLEKRDSIKSVIKSMIPCVISIVSFSVLYVVARFFVFGIASGSYSYQITVSHIPQNSDKNPVSFFFYAFLFYFGYIVLVNNIFPLFIREDDKDCLNYRASMFIEIVIISLLLVVVYKITLKEDYGLMSPRLHFRYFEPLFFPYTICFIARLNNLEEKRILEKKYSKLAFGIYLLVLMVLPGLNSDGLLDSTTLMTYLIPERIAYSCFLGSPRKTVIMTMLMKLIILVVVLLGIMLLKKNKNKFLIIFLSVVFVINSTNIYLKYHDIRKTYELPQSYVDEMQEVNDELESLSGRKLMVARQYMLVSDVMTTYYDVNNTDVYYADADYVTTDKVITLSAGGGVSREANIDDYSYIVYENGVWEDSDRESIPPEKIILSTEHFFILEN